MGIGASFAGGLTQFYHSGSTVKRLHAAQAASSGVKAALLVKSGFSGPADILEGKDGFFRAYADSLDASILSQGLGSYFRISEVAVKPHACSARVLSAIEATAHICKQHRIDVEQIQSIYLGIPKVIQGRLTSIAPKDVQAAQMSAPFCVALTLLQNHDAQIFSLSVEDFELGMKNQQVMHLTSLVNCVVDEEIEKTSSEEAVSAKVTIQLKNGEEFSNLIIAPKGSISRPFALEDHQLRMKHELLKRYPENQINQFERLILEFPKVKDITQEIATAWLN
jgi:2-methylcitrate dehydratase PrpD